MKSEMKETVKMFKLESRLDEERTSIYCKDVVAILCKSSTKV